MTEFPNGPRATPRLVAPGYAKILVGNDAGLSHQDRLSRLKAFSEAFRGGLSGPAQEPSANSPFETLDDAIRIHEGLLPRVYVPVNHDGQITLDPAVIERVVGIFPEEAFSLPDAIPSVDCPQTRLQAGKLIALKDLRRQLEESAHGIWALEAKLDNARE